MKLTPEAEQEWCARYLRGELSAEKVDVLEQYLRTNDEARARFRQSARLDANLRAAASEVEAGATWSQLSMPAYGKLAGAEKRVRSSGWWLWIGWRRLAAAAAMVLVTIGIWRWQQHPNESAGKGVAVLARAVEAQWESEAHEAGAVLGPGTLRLKSGAVLVEFYSGARAVLEGAAELQLVSANEATLSFGRLNAHVPPQARGFTVRSDGIAVVDHGTDFGMNIVGDAAAEVHVFSGKVEVAAASQPPRPLLAGEAARIGRGRSQWQPIVSAREAFLAEPELIRRDETAAHRRFAAWREFSQALDADAATLVHFTFEESASAARSVVNRSDGATDASHGSIVGATWVDGRWAGKAALHFHGEGDRVRFTAAQPMNALTLLAWVRVESLDRSQNVLLCAEKEQTGALHWHLTRRGELRLEIARDLGHPRLDWEAVNSIPFVTPARFGQWLLLVTTFDGRTIRHYANGEPIGSGASFTPPALHIGTAELGNWSGGTQRHLETTLDEFAILSRVMSAEEVRAIFQRNKP